MNRIISLLVLLLISCGAFAQRVPDMALPSIPTAPTDLLYIIQGGLDHQITMQQLSGAINGGRAVVAPPLTGNAAPTIRAAQCSNCYVTLAPGAYTFSSTVTSPYSYNDPPAVLWQSQTNFVLDMSAATITIADSIALSCAFTFDRNTNYMVILPKIIGSRFGLTALQENVGICTHSAVNANYIGGVFSGYGGNGAAFNGDWIVNSTFRGAVMNGVGICFDTAFLKDVKISDFRGTGADTNGATGVNQIGSKCYSNVYDVPGVNDNFTGVSYTDTDGVSITNGSATGFDVGAYIASGNHYYIAGNHWFNNLGCSAIIGTCTATLQGFGMLIDYKASGPSSSVSHPPGNIFSTGDSFVGNGNAVVGGFGVEIANNSIVNGDVIGNVSISGIFDNNVNTGVEATSSSHLGAVTVSAASVFSGASQTTWVGANLIASNPTPSALVTAYQGQPGTIVVAPNLTVSVARAASLTYTALPAGTPTNYACFTAGALIVISAAPC